MCKQDYEVKNCGVILGSAELIDDKAIEEIRQDRIMREPEESNHENDNSEISIDELYADLGEIGLWQWMGMTLLWLPSLAAGMIVLTFSFAGKKEIKNAYYTIFRRSQSNTFYYSLAGLQPKSFHCSTYSDTCQNAMVMLTNPPVLAFGTNKDGSIDFCQSRPWAASNDTDCQFDMSQSLQKCNTHALGGRIDYGPFAMDTTIVTEFNLICDDAYKVSNPEKCLGNNTTFEPEIDITGWSCWKHFHGWHVFWSCIIWETL